MSLFKAGSSSQSTYLLNAERVYLRTPQFSDYAQWADLRLRSHHFLQPWEPTWPVDDLTKVAFRKRIRRYNLLLRDRTHYPFFLFSRRSDQLLGGINLSNVRRGVAQTATVGYWMGEPFAGNGYMREAVQRLCHFSFEQLNLHRLEAACLPTNETSKALLTKCGFSQVGYAPSYLLINGEWQDHILFGKIRDLALPMNKVLPQSEADGDKLPGIPA